MELQDFIMEFAEQFDDINANEINKTTNFQELYSWSSLTALSIIAFVMLKYKKKISGAEIRMCKTVNDLYDFILSK